MTGNDVIVWDGLTSVSEMAGEARRPCYSFVDSLGAFVISDDDKAQDVRHMCARLGVIDYQFSASAQRCITSVAPKLPEPRALDHASKLVIERFS